MMRARSLLAASLAITMLVAVSALADPEQGTGGVPPQAAAHGAEDQAHQIVHPDEDHDAGPGHAPETYFGIPGWILKLINMLLFFGLLAWLLKGPIGRALAGRRSQIQRDLAEAAERRARSESLAADIQSRLEQIEAEVAMILARAQEEGQRQRDEMIRAGERDAEKILEQARAEVESRSRQARLELSEYARELAVERAARLIDESVTEQDRQRLFAERVEEISEVRS